MSQNKDRKKRPVLAKESEAGALSTIMVIRLVIASVIFAVALIIDMPEFLSIILLVLSAVSAGYDIVIQAAHCVEDGDYFATPVVVTFIALVAFFIGFSLEGAALLVLYQIGCMLIFYARKHTQKAAMELLNYQDDAVIQRMRDCFSKTNATATSIESTMKSSSGTILKLAMIIAVVYAIAVPLITSTSYIVAIHRAITIILIATPMSVVVSIPVAAMVGMCYSAQQGVAFDSAASFEALSDSGIAIFDKAGIFAEESPRLIAMYSDVLDSNTFMNFVAHSVYYSDQPMAKAIADVFDQEYRLDIIKDFREIPGYGVDLSIDGIHVTFASRELFRSRGVDLPDDINSSGQVYFMVVAEKYVGQVVISSDVNEESESIVPDMKSAGIPRCVLLTEDSKESSQQFAELMNFSEMYSQCDPEKKLEIVSDISKKAKGAVLFIYANGIDSHSDATVDMRVSKKGKYADALVDPAYVNNIPFAKQVSVRFKQVAIENAVFAFAVKALLIFLSIVGYCNLWFAIFIDMIAAVMAILNTIRVTSDTLVNAWRYKTGK